MSLWTSLGRNSRLQELLGGSPRVVLGEVIETEAESVELDDERAVVLFVERADEAYDEYADEDDHSWEIILGSFAALAVSGAVLYMGLARCYPVQMRRFEDASRNALQTVVQGLSRVGAPNRSQVDTTSIRQDLESSSVSSTSSWDRSSTSIMTSSSVSVSTTTGRSERVELHELRLLQSIVREIYMDSGETEESDNDSDLEGTDDPADTVEVGLRPFIPPLNSSSPVPLDPVAELSEDDSAEDLPIPGPRAMAIPHSFRSAAAQAVQASLANDLAETEDYGIAVLWSESTGQSSGNQVLSGDVEPVAGNESLPALPESEDEEDDAVELVPGGAGLRTRSVSLPVPEGGEKVPTFSRSVSSPAVPSDQNRSESQVLNENLVSTPGVGDFLQEILDVPPPLRRSRRISIPTCRYSPY